MDEGGRLAWRLVISGIQHHSPVFFWALNKRGVFFCYFAGGSWRLRGETFAH
jgi:hypothetical protein